MNNHIMNTISWAWKSTFPKKVLLSSSTYKL